MPPSFTKWQRKVRQRFPSRAKPPSDSCSSSAEPGSISPRLDKIQDSAASSHMYPTINASDHTTLHLGDVHYNVGPPSASAKEQLMTTLYFPEMFKRFDNIEDPHSDTFEWILHPPELEQPPWSPFLDWLQQTGGLYWISGKPGSGKSVLTKYLAQYAEQARGEGEGQPLIVLSFWFWEAAHTPQERNLSGCLKSLLWQLLNHSRHGDTICKVVSSNVSFEWTLKRLHHALNNALLHISRLGEPVLLFLDGLDECGDSGRDVLRFATSIVKQHNNLKACVSSRPEPHFEFALSSYPHLRMQDLNQPDVYAIIDQDLLHTPEFNLVAKKERQSEDLRDGIAGMARGVLLWVRLVTRDLLQGIIDGDTVLQLQDRLIKMPSELDGEDGIYAFMLKRNAANSKSCLADAAFYLQLADHRSMSVIEFCLASNKAMRSSYIQLTNDWERLHLELDCDRMVRAICARTAGLLEVVQHPERLSRRAAKTRCTVLANILNDYGRSRVDFIHRTARTYVLETLAGHRILAASTKSSDDVKHICFETWLISDIMLPSLESVAPKGLPEKPGGWPACNNCVVTRPESFLRKMKYVIRQLERRSFLWKETYQRPYWSAFDFPHPWPELNDHRIGFGLLFASLAIWDFAKFEISDMAVFDASDMIELFRCVELGYIRQQRTIVHDRNIEVPSKLYDEMMLRCPGPDSELTNTYGEQIPVFYPILFAYWIPKILGAARPMIDLWLKEASVSLRTRRCRPTMSDCSRVFFRRRSNNMLTLLGAFSYTDVESLLVRVLQMDFPEKRLDGLDTDYVVLHWPGGAWVPAMYKLSPSDSAMLLQNMVDSMKSDDMVRPLTVGIIETDEGWFSDFVSTTLTRATKVKSLSEAFKLLGKTAESIDRFAMAEDARIQLTYDDVIYQHWRSWMYGIFDPILQQYQHIERPYHFYYCLEDLPCLLREYPQKLR